MNIRIKIIGSFSLVNTVAHELLLSGPQVINFHIYIDANLVSLGIFLTSHISVPVYLISV